MKNRETFHQTLAMMTIGLNEFAVAIDDGWLTPSINVLVNSNEEFLLTFDHYTWSYSLDKYIGRIFGAVMAAILLDKVGRKPLLSTCAITFCSTWLLLLFAKSTWIFILARTAFGIASGINDVTNAVYLGENSSPSKRGIFGTIIRSIYSLGYLIGFISATFLYFKNAALINFFITLLSLISAFWMVEPVQYLLMKGKFDQAKKNFIWLKGIADSEEVTQEFEKIKQNVYAETSKETSFIKIFTYPANYRSLLMVLTISSLVGLMNYYNLESGVGWLFYATFFTLEFTSTVNNFTIILGVTQFLVMASTTFIICRFNRRSLIMILFSLISITLFLIAALIYLQTMKVLPNNLWLVSICISILFFNSIYAFALTTLFLLRSELFPLSMKAVGGSLSIIGYTLSRFLMSIILFRQFERSHFIFILFSGIGVIVVLFLYYIKLPETENKSLIEIQKKLEGEN